jgi:thiol-disulfide isomerase/thioredoxin
MPAVLSASLRLVATLLLAGFIAGCGSGDHELVAQDPPAAGEGVPAENPYPGRFDAPSLDGGGDWLNTSKPIALEDLKGKIVLLDFWTYCCINCIHVLPDLKFLEEKYPNELVVIGVHAAKFDNEKVTANIREAVLRYEIAHPVVNDANMTIARKYFFQSWPTLVVIDPEGKYVGRVSGEGNRELLDDVIGQMIAWHRAKGTLNETPLKFDLERGRAPATPLRFPGKLVTDEAHDRLYISDSNHNRIVVASLDGKLVDVIGTGEMGTRDGGYAEAQFDHPQGMTLIGDTLYVADTENHLIRTIDLNGKQVATLSGTGEQARMRVAAGPLAATALNSPWDLAHLDGTLYVCMAGPHQLWKHKLGGPTIEVFAGNGREDIVDGPLLDGSLAQPSGITHDGAALYFVDSEGSAVRKATTGLGGVLTTIAGPHDLERGRALFEFGDIDGVGDEARLQHPLGVVYHEGGLLVADTYNHKLKRVDLAKRSSTTWLGTGERGVGLAPVQLNEPAGLAIARGMLYVADTNNHRLLTVDLATKATRELTIEGLTPPGVH